MRRESRESSVLATSHTRYQRIPLYFYASTMLRRARDHTLNPNRGMANICSGDMHVLMRTVVATPRGWCNA